MPMRASDPLRTLRRSCRLSAMRLPPHTSKWVLEELEKQPRVRRRIARGWVLVGSVVFASACAIAVSYYVYGMPIHDRNTGQPATPEDTLAGLLTLGGGGALFVVMGILLLRWKGTE